MFPEVAYKGECYKTVDFLLSRSAPWRTPDYHNQYAIGDVKEASKNGFRCEMW
ncbi:hypothetical protein MNBD_NITROSPINAE02-422 [hydrothermal vent metagenome]|uniref:Uncharacterized protein n=1 Tax=hydrothermal vent metagenome TaxID=652676 RepID=A0A3B1CMD6_9ZZZZ